MGPRGWAHFTSSLYRMEKWEMVVCSELISLSGDRASREARAPDSASSAFSILV